MATLGQSYGYKPLPQEGGLLALRAAFLSHAVLISANAVSSYSSCQLGNFICIPFTRITSKN